MQTAERHNGRTPDPKARVHFWKSFSGKKLSDVYFQKSMYKLIIFRVYFC